jgi:hypothetical protein
LSWAWAITASVKPTVASAIVERIASSDIRAGLSTGQLHLS